MSWVSLVNHSQYSVLQSTISIKALVNKAKQLGLKELTLTDSGNLFGAVDFYKTCLAANIRPIIGSQLQMSHTSRLIKTRNLERPNSSSIVLLAKNEVGYRNLCRLSSAGFLEGFYYVPRIDKELLFECSEGLICLSGGLNSYHGYYALRRPDSELEQECNDFVHAFGDDFILQAQRLTMDPADIRQDGVEDEPWLIQKYEEQEQNRLRIEERLFPLARKKNILIAATQESFYLERTDWRAHEILLNIQSGEPSEIWQRDSMGNPVGRVKNPKRDVLASHEHFFKSQDQMEAIFKDYPEAISCTKEIADRCHFNFDFKTKHYPSFVPPDSKHLVHEPQALAEAISKYLTKECHEAIKVRYNSEKLAEVAKISHTNDPMKVILDRLATELDTILGKGLADYLLIVADFIRWAKDQGIPVGPGRGSGAGSIVCYLLGITDIEPLRFHLFFERFINPERVSYPDIDVDICMDRRCEVIDYMLKKYGKENVAQIITFGTMKAKMSLKDVGRVLNVALSKVNLICKMLPEDLNLTLADALNDQEVKKMYEEDEETRNLFDVAKVLEGCIRNTGIHAAGLIVCGEPLVNYLPLYSSKDAEMPVTQFSMKPAEMVGMLKIDFLGLKTLTSIQKCVEQIEINHNLKINWFELPLDNQAAFQLLNKGRTMGVFQMESAGMQDLARQLHLDRFEEIIAVVSLYRPGPMDMIPSFINRKHKKEPIEYDHPWLEDILSETYGIMVYQEQVMQIASKLAGFTLAEGDVLRRAMGKKDAQEMSSQREKFLEGAKEKGIGDSISALIFDKMEKFAAYGFNKSHAAAYAYIAYVTAYLKANYTKEWMAALMTCDHHDLSKVSKFIAECRAINVDILSPDVNESFQEFRATPKGIRFALNAIKGMGSAVIETIEQQRLKSGFFANLQDFLNQIDLKRVSKKNVELLIDSGAFDFTSWTRDQLQQSLEPLYANAMQVQQDKQKGVMTLFALLDDSKSTAAWQPQEVIHPRSVLQMLLREKELLGFFLTGNPMQVYQKSLNRLSYVPLDTVSQLNQNNVLRTAFVIDEIVIKVSQKTQKKFALLKISDGHERFDLPIWPEFYERYSHLLQENRLLGAVLMAEVQDSIRLSCRWLVDITQLQESDVQACDDAYDKAKAIMQAPKRRNDTNSSSSVVQKMMTVRLSFHASRMQFSDLLKLSSLIKNHPGKQPVEILFSGSGRKDRILSLPAAYSIQLSSELEKKLKENFPLEGLTQEAVNRSS
jgi:DNA polymerase-3 subunit alpha